MFPGRRGERKSIFETHGEGFGVVRRMLRHSSGRRPTVAEYIPSFCD